MQQSLWENVFVVRHVWIAVRQKNCNLVLLEYCTQTIFCGIDAITDNYYGQKLALFKESALIQLNIYGKKCNVLFVSHMPQIILLDIQQNNISILFCKVAEILVFITCYALFLKSDWLVVLLSLSK